MLAYSSGTTPSVHRRDRRTVSRLCRDSQWPLSGSIPVAIPTEFHLNRYCRWLLSAGADPRLSIVLCAGAGAKQSFIDGVRARKIIPELAPARSQRPVAENLSKHQGTHFNSTLFIVDGLESLTRDAFSTLNGQRGLLNRGDLGGHCGGDMETLVDSIK